MLSIDISGKKDLNHFIFGIFQRLKVKDQKKSIIYATFYLIIGIWRHY
jgi:hypothetical protein